MVYLFIDIQVDGVLILRMVALHAGVMYCTEITDALWRRYLSQHPENLIDEDSSLIHFARFVSLKVSEGIVNRFLQDPVYSTDSKEFWR